MKKVKHKEDMKSERNSDTLEECNTKKVQNGKSPAQKEHVKEIAKDKKNAIPKSATWKDCYMKKVQQEKSATRRKFNMRKVQHETSVQ